MDRIANFLEWCRDSRTFRLGVAIICGAIGSALSGVVTWPVAIGGALLSIQAMLARVGGFADAKDVEAGKPLDVVNPPGASGVSGTRGRASLGACVSIAVVLALASVAVGCVSPIARENATALDRSARNLAAALAQDAGASKGERAEAGAIVECADANCGYLGAPTATATIGGR